MNEQQYLDHLKALHSVNWPAEISREPVYPLGEIALTDYLRQRAAETPDQSVCIFYGNELGFAQLNQQSDAFAAVLQQHGVKRGDRVGVMLPNCPQFLVAFFAILKLDAIHVPVNPLFKPAELQYQLNDAGVKVMVALNQLVPAIKAVRDNTSLELLFTTSMSEHLPPEPTIPIPDSIRLPNLPVNLEWAFDFQTVIDSAPKIEITAGRDLDAPAVLNYTGGTTGLPKGCIHTQRDMIYTAACIQSAAAVSSGSNQVSLNFMPVFWISGQTTIIVLPVFSGNPTVLMSRWDPVGFMKAIEHYQVTATGGLVDTIAEVLDHPDVEKFDLRSLQVTVCSSFVKKLNVEYRSRWQKLTGSPLFETGWGMTETHSFDTFTAGMQVNNFDLSSEPVFVGIPAPGTEIKICDFTTGEILPLGEKGEICLRSPSVFKGYWNTNISSDSSLRDGWLHSGDIGMFDEQGYLHYLGRNKEMIKVNGMSVFPAEIESLLAQNPAINGSAVIPRADEERGQVPVAFVRLTEKAKADGVTNLELNQWCWENIASYKIPEVIILDQFPLTVTGKVIKHELVKLLPN